MYQVYPRSFQDTDGDGMGDLKGIQERLPYLKQLGVGFIWLSPVMKSPQRDFGYDISDFEDVSSIFGTLDDMKSLLAEAKKQGLRILMDFVPNHSSNESKWFNESRSSKTNPKRDWYIWHPGNVLANGSRSPPNNWASNFGGGLGSSWTWDETSEEYYYHAFGEFQPDLNYRNPEVVEAMQDVLRFWLRLGASGFRVDAVPFLLEDTQLRDESVDVSCTAAEPIWNCMNHSHTQNDPLNHDIIAGWRSTIDEFPDACMFGEIYASVGDVMTYYGTLAAPEFNVPFNFNVMSPKGYGIPSDLKDSALVLKSIREYADALPEWAHGNWALGNHDNHRLMDRTGNDTKFCSTIYATLNLLPGTPVIYNGDELAMRDLWIPYDKCKDPMCIKNPDKFWMTGRDPERTPMQWDATANSGFSKANSTWLPVNPDYISLNVKLQEKVVSSPLSVMMETLKFRKANPEIALGKITFVLEHLPSELSGKLVAIKYQMRGQSGNDSTMTLANWDSVSPLTFDLPLLLPDAERGTGCTWTSLFSTLSSAVLGQTDPTAITLKPGEVMVISASSCGTPPLLV